MPRGGWRGGGRPDKGYIKRTSVKLTADMVVDLAWLRGFLDLPTDQEAWDTALKLAVAHARKCTDVNTLTT